ncbi:putative mRNA-splicing protein ubp10 [Mycena sanguinolenta]|uniref:Putative mRNA-splicing protein ubp10 n=1 Tax=Mycena sanguinolenta TaxID=230812 RepID=A0A8H6XAS3_9AGAR|nr:putative mRNA-splicing protein ubp10 [Mycena sanguinolenta]
MPSTTRPSPGEDERPSKRTKVSSEEEDAEILPNPANDEDEAEDLEDTWQEPTEARASDLYLDTAMSLTNINIYGCLVCGKYFQGRGRNSPPRQINMLHSLFAAHAIYFQVYVLPDGYPVSDPSLDDISFVLAPFFNPASIVNLSSPAHLAKPSYDLANKVYLPGYVGLNNIKRNDHMNVIIHCLLHIPPLRDNLLLSNLRGKESELLKRFAGLAKKLWNPRLFKGQVSPHEFLQEVNRASAGKFRLEQQGDPVEFLGWLLNRLHKDTGGSKRQNSSIIFTTFQGQLRVETQQVLLRSDAGENEKPRFDIARDIKSTVSPFLFLAVDLPPPPLFQDAVEKNIIPQVGIHSVLAKYDGRTTQVSAISLPEHFVSNLVIEESAGQLRRYKCQRLPPYIILHFKRFTKNAFVEEKNPTIVNFPLRGLDFREYVDAMPSGESTVYDLIANVTHESVAGTTRDKENTVWKVYLRAAGGGGEGEKWFMIQDLIVEEARKEMIFLGETVLQVGSHFPIRVCGLIKISPRFGSEDPVRPEGV